MRSGLAFAYQRRREWVCTGPSAEVMKAFGQAFLEDLVESLVRGEECRQIAADGAVVHPALAHSTSWSRCPVGGVFGNQRGRDRLQFAANLHDVGVVCRLDLGESADRPAA
jgi:hypothetical protein